MKSLLASLQGETGRNEMRQLSCSALRLCKTNVHTVMDVPWLHAAIEAKVVQEASKRKHVNNNIRHTHAIGAVEKG
eukprot:6471239-Amphidinium_carterae.1